MKTDIHTIVFSNKYWTPKTATEWLKKHTSNFKPIKRVHKTLNTFRYRLRDPKLFKSFITKKTKLGINIVIGIYY